MKDLTKPSIYNIGYIGIGEYKTSEVKQSSSKFLKNITYTNLKLEQEIVK